MIKSLALISAPVKKIGQSDKGDGLRIFACRRARDLGGYTLPSPLVGYSTGEEVRLADNLLREGAFSRRLRSKESSDWN